MADRLMAAELFKHPLYRFLRADRRIFRLASLLKIRLCSLTVEKYPFPSPLPVIIFHPLSYLNTNKTYSKEHVLHDSNQFVEYLSSKLVFWLFTNRCALTSVYTTDYQITITAFYFINTN